MSKSFLNTRYNHHDNSASARAERSFYSLSRRAPKVKWSNFFAEFAKFMEMISEEIGNRNVFWLVSDMFKGLDPTLLDEYIENFHANLDQHDKSKKTDYEPNLENLRLRLSTKHVGRKNFFKELSVLLEWILEEEGKSTVFDMLSFLFEAMGLDEVGGNLHLLHKALDKHDPTKKRSSLKKTTTKAMFNAAMGKLRTEVKSKHSDDEKRAEFLRRAHKFLDHCLSTPDKKQKNRSNKSLAPLGQALRARIYYVHQNDMNRSFQLISELISYLHSEEDKPRLQAV